MFAENVKRLREQKELSQAEIAKMLGVSQPAIAQYETGIKIPSIIVAVKLARILGVTCEQLVE